MSELVFVTGGGRSGKSAYAQQQAEAIPGPRTYIATCPVLDEEMTRRVARHQADREGKGWQTIEEPVELARIIEEIPDGATVLVDCLTLWINNLMFAAEQDGCDFQEADIILIADELARAAQRHNGAVYIVSNEIGLGIIPANEMARRFRDIAGRCNQIIAAAADHVVLLISGIPMTIKEPEQ